MIGKVVRELRYGGGGWFIDGIPIHPIDADKYSYYNGNSVPTLKYEGQDVFYWLEDYKESIFPERKYFRIDEKKTNRLNKIKSILTDED
jgi:hypothetical protein